MTASTSSGEFCVLSDYRGRERWGERLPRDELPRQPSSSSRRRSRINPTDCGDTENWASHTRSISLTASPLRAPKRRESCDASILSTESFGSALLLQMNHHRCSIDDDMEIEDEDDDCGYNCDEQSINSTASFRSVVSTGWACHQRTSIPVTPSPMKVRRKPSCLGACHPLQGKVHQKRQSSRRPDPPSLFW